MEEFLRANPGLQRFNVPFPSVLCCHPYVFPNLLCYSFILNLVAYVCQINKLKELDDYSSNDLAQIVQART